MKRVCPHCGAPMYHDICEYCQMPTNPQMPSAGTKSHKFVWLAIALAVIVFFGTVCAVYAAVRRIRPSVPMAFANRTENSTNDAAALDKMQESGVFSSGTYLVGEEIPAGEYVLVSASSSGDYLFYTGVYADREKEQEISGGWNEYSAIVQLEEGTYFDFSWANCYDVTKNTVPNDPMKRPGMFYVGRDIAPGSYCIVPYSDENSSPYPSYEIYTALGSVAPVIAESGSLHDLSSGELLDAVTVTLKEGQYLKLTECIIQE